MSAPSRNSFLDGSMPVVFARTALPIIFVMGMNGSLNVADALFLGHFVGPDALAAVTLIFPLFMLIVALSSLVSTGMSSLLARLLGGDRLEEARTVYASAHWLAIAVGIALAPGFGDTAIWWGSPGSDLLLLGLTVVVLMQNARSSSLRWGLFGDPTKAAA